MPIQSCPGGTSLGAGGAAVRLLLWQAGGSRIGEHRANRAVSLWWVSRLRRPDSLNLVLLTGDMGVDYLDLASRTEIEFAIVIGLPIEVIRWAWGKARRFRQARARSRGA